jgi:hypothetical protein
MQRTQTEWTDRTPPQPLRCEAALQLDRDSDSGRLPDGCEKADRLVDQASQGHLKCPGRRRVEPLHVIEGHDHKSSLSHKPQDVEHSQPNGVRVWGRVARLDQQQRHLQCTPARWREDEQHLIEHGSE